MVSLLWIELGAGCCWPSVLVRVANGDAVLVLFWAPLVAAMVSFSLDAFLFVHGAAALVSSHLKLKKTPYFFLEIDENIKVTIGNITFKRPDSRASPFKVMHPFRLRLLILLARASISVDLPDPLGPKIAIISRSFASPEMSLSKLLTFVFFPQHGNLDLLPTTLTS
ncbi:hypothetical protein F3Y22_tig00110410pilonHSYRG00033 [Hibiscus syriacus]|uniref:Uncharacterized protein n=1 Tax=Hibiscus syriacus TaxID=106335 RepID=A0A6A3ASX9_HIBSY|nr:hypothetical protein F3Y22_tig00110410pilonHSYRG00033 [Hibiscus syriacus]